MSSVYRTSGPPAPWHVVLLWELVAFAVTGGAVWAYAAA